jgi:quinolinate synthase
MLLTNYLDRPPQEVLTRIEEIKCGLGKSTVILGHHYLRDEVIRFADHRGDSLELSRLAASCGDAAYIVFCGVDFMAESAALLCDEQQRVLIPSGEARCPMAAMADREGAQRAWDELMQVWGPDIMPVTYQNSGAEVKAFCGELGGAVCTSSNAKAVFQWALGQRGHILFFPDEHLGRNTASSLGIAAEEIAVWDPEEPPGNHPGLRDASVVVWKGYCGVHTHFTLAHVEEARRRYPGARVVVHPECTAEVVRRSDLAGSTSRIVRVVEEAAAGATLVIGTEMNLVSRLAAQHPGKTVVPLAPSLCAGMSLIDAQHLLSVLEAILEGCLEDAVRVPAETVAGATRALQTMLTVV